MSITLIPELAWVDGRFVPGLAVSLDGDRIEAVRPAGDVPAGSRVVHLRRSALLPGFINAHSHAFQRGLRGKGQTFPAGAGSFWTWRESMYDLVNSLDPESMYQWSRRAFAEMLARGITSVGEFHYLHHHTDGLDFELDDAVVRAAHDSGIRIVLIQTLYRTGAPGRELESGQRRFRGPEPTAFWDAVDRARGLPGMSDRAVGVAAHSVRAVHQDEIRELALEARRRGLIMHMHVEEQIREIDESEAYYGRTPMDVVLDAVLPGPWFTAVHCTHTSATDMERYGATGANVCLCPITEADLGDGISDPEHMLASGAGICLGSDSNVRLSMLEEMRLAEYAQRLAFQKRGALAQRDGTLAARLIGFATAGGARALDLNTGAIASGRLADFAVVDLDCEGIAGTPTELLGEALVFGAPDAAIAGSIVGGRFVGLDMPSPVVLS